MGCEQQLEPWSPLSPFFHELRTYTRLYEDIQQQRTRTSNQLHALRHSVVEMQSAIQVSEQLQAAFDHEPIRVKQLIEQHVNSNDPVKERIDKLCSIKGVGVLTAATIAAETNGFALFHNIPQLVSYAGYDVVENQSGKRVGKTRISKKGNSHI